MRPNGRRTVYGSDDLAAIVAGAPDRFHGIIMPKVLDRDDIELLDETLTRLEAQAGWSCRLQIEALIETVRRGERVPSETSDSAAQPAERSNHRG